MSDIVEPLKLPLHPIIRTRLRTLMGENEMLQYEIEKLRAALRGVLTYYNAPTPAEAKLKKAVLATPIEQAYAALGEKNEQVSD